jgi:hypothetical protein
MLTSSAAHSSCFFVTREAKHKYQMERLMASARTEQTAAQLTIQDLQVQLKAQKVHIYLLEHCLNHGLKGCTSTVSTLGRHCLTTA